MTKTSYNESTNPLTKKKERHRITAIALASLNIGKSIIEPEPSFLSWKRGINSTSQIYWDTPISPISTRVKLFILADKKYSDDWEVKYAISWIANSGFGNTNYIKIIHRNSREGAEQSIRNMIENASKYDYRLVVADKSRIAITEILLQEQVIRPSETTISIA